MWNSNIMIILYAIILLRLFINFRPCLYWLRIHNEDKLHFSISIQDHRFVQYDFAFLRFFVIFRWWMRWVDGWMGMGKNESAANSILMNFAWRVHKRYSTRRCFHMTLNRSLSSCNNRLLLNYRKTFTFGNISILCYHLRVHHVHEMT